MARALSRDAMDGTPVRTTAHKGRSWRDWRSNDVCQCNLEPTPRITQQP